MYICKAPLGKRGEINGESSIMASIGIQMLRVCALFIVLVDKRQNCPKSFLILFRFSVVKFLRLANILDVSKSFSTKYKNMAFWYKIHQFVLGLELKKWPQCPTIVLATEQ